MLETGASPTTLWKHLVEPGSSRLRTCKNCSTTSAKTALNTMLRRISQLWRPWLMKRRQTTWVGRCTGTARNGWREIAAQKPQSTVESSPQQKTDKKKALWPLQPEWISGPSAAASLLDLLPQTLAPRS